MPALLAASARRTEHEISAHAYHHKTLQEQTRVPYSMAAAARAKQRSNNS